MKKPLALLLTSFIVTGLFAGSFTVCAAGSDAEDHAVIDAPEYGFHFECPEAYRQENLKGVIDWQADYLDTGLLHVSPVYYAISPDRIPDYLQCLEEESADLPEGSDPGWFTGYEFGCLFEVFFINEGRKEDELRQLLKISNGWYEDNFSWLEELGSDGDTTFFLAQYSQPEDDSEKYREYMGSFYDEFVSLYEDRDSFRSALTLSAPQWPHMTAAGDQLSFETTDLEGNPVTSADLFGGHKVTMVNIWATWCGPCVAELPELEKLAGEFEAQECQIIGLCYDAADEETVQEALSILSDSGVNFLNICPPDDIDSVFMLEAYPSSFFVDSSGKVLTDPVVGAYPDTYSEVLAEALALVE